VSQLSQIVIQLQTQRKHVQSELGCLDAAINALRGLNANNGSAIVGASPIHRKLSAAGRRAISLAQKARWAAKNHAAAKTKPRRTMSAAARRKIAAAQKARWAKVRETTKVVSIRGKRTLSAAARKRIAAAQRARWARVKAAKKTA
jgi:hypothetical protein